MRTNIFEQILYGLKVANDNMVILNDKIEQVMEILSCEETGQVDNDKGCNSCRE